MNEVTIKTSVELLPFGSLRHCETVSFQIVAPELEPTVDLRAGTTLVREILASEPARVMRR